MKIRTTANYEKQPGEVFKQPSLTRPDMTYTPKEMLLRYQRGLPLDKVRDMSYHGDDMYPDTRSMDLVEVQEQIDKVRDTIERGKAELQEKEAKRKQRRKELLDRARADKASQDTSGSPQAQNQASQ